jgi:hypothetical protein
VERKYFAGASLRGGVSAVSAAPTNVVATAALELLSAGFCPIPIPPRSKAPNHPGWQNQRVTADAVPQTFSENSNIGILLGEAGNGRADLDCDCIEAIALAPAFLPATGFIHGRPSRPRSHYSYTAVPVPTHRKFESGGECLLELRTVGQTVVPPSIHPSGEQLSWDVAEGAPATVTGDVLSTAARELAAATLILRCWKKSGRHALALPLAGFLLRQQGWDQERVHHFVTAVATVARDEETADRQNVVATTAQLLAVDGHATGGTELRKVIGNAVFDKFCEWLGFAKSSSTRFEPPTVEAANVAPETVPSWPVETLEGDYISDLAYRQTVGTPVPPQFIREQTISILAAKADGKLGYPRHSDIPDRRFLALISERAQACKGESRKRLVGTSGEGGALRPLIDNDNLKLLNGSGIGSGQYLAKELEDNPRAEIHFDEGSQLFQVAGQQNSTLSAALRSLFEGNSHWSGSFTNKKHGGDDLHLSLSLHSTRKTFVEGFAVRGGVGDGLLSRFTLVYSDYMPVVPEWEPRDLREERKIVAIIGNLIPKVLTVPTIADDARECMKSFACAVNSPTHSHPDHTRRLLELTKLDLLHRCVYSGSPQITLEMAERSVLWGNHQLALRLAFWPPDAKDVTAAMTQLLLNRLRRGSASLRDLRTAANVYRDGTHETFARCLSALKKSGELIVLGKNRRQQEIFGLEAETEAETTAAETAVETGKRS